MSAQLSWLERLGSDPHARAGLRAFLAFWVLGLLNNAAYVIMIAGANEISSGAVGAVYLCAIGPTIVVKLTGPYWFHRVSYSQRVWAAAALMAAAYTLVALSRSLGPQLLGVALVALQGGLGEATMLGLCASFHSQRTITAWSSGTGFAGVAGYAWVAILHELMKLSFPATLLLANITAVLWLATYHFLLPQPAVLLRGGSEHYATLDTDEPAGWGQGALPPHEGAESSEGAVELIVSPAPSRAGSPLGPLGQAAPSQQPHRQPTPDGERARLLPSGSGLSGSSSAFNGGAATKRAAGHGPASVADDASAAAPAGSAPLTEGAAAISAAAHMTFRERLAATAQLWPYMVPLFLVYFSEYAMQAGTWTAIGFPVTNPDARRRFYLFANSSYQAGVFISRSSGLIYQADRAALWAMPLAQCVLLLLFFWDAVSHWWYGWSLLGPCFVVGLLGGAVYVNAFTLLSREVAPHMREFSLAAACVADSLGIAAADVAGILIQGCLFRWNGLTGAAFACGAR